MSDFIFSPQGLMTMFLGSIFFTVIKHYYRQMVRDHRAEDERGRTTRERISSLYEMTQTNTERLARVEARVEDRFAQLDARLSDLDARLTANYGRGYTIGVDVGGRGGAGGEAGRPGGNGGDGSVMFIASGGGGGGGSRSSENGILDRERLRRSAMNRAGGGQVTLGGIPDAMLMELMAAPPRTTTALGQALQAAMPPAVPAQPKPEPPSLMASLMADED